MKRVRDWLPDWLMLHSSDAVQRMARVSDIIDREVASESDAHRAVNLHLDTYIAWLDGCRPKAGP